MMESAIWREMDGNYLFDGFGIRGEVEREGEWVVACAEEVRR